MSSASIQAKVKLGLSKASAAVGSDTSTPIYRVVKSQSGNPTAPASSEVSTLLPNAIFKSYDKGLTDTSIQMGDRMLVSDSDNAITQNDIIRQGEKDYIVVAVDEKSPRGNPLAYISQVRQQ